MAAGMPIVYAGTGTAATLVDATGSGIVTAAGDANAIAAAVRRAATPEGRDMGARGAAYVSELPSRSDEMRQFVRLLGKVAGS
jgi:glycosyltransferase involved in cell wall biosynthesis